MSEIYDGNAIIYCEGSFGTTNGKTAHGLVRRTNRYRILSVVDSLCAGQDAGVLLDGKEKNIPIFPDIQRAIGSASESGIPVTHLIIGLAPDGGQLNHNTRKDVIDAISHGLNIDSGLHDFLYDDIEIRKLAVNYNVKIRDIRRPPSREMLHFFNGKIREVDSLKIAVLGTDSAVGKRTTAWALVDAFEKAGHSAELVGTGQTAWMQGARYCIMLDSLVVDFITGEIEHAVWQAWHDRNPDAIIIEGQGSLLNPAYPGGLEILSAARPDVVVLQHVPARKEYDGFPGFSLHPLEKQIKAIEIISEKPVGAITINHEQLSSTEITKICNKVSDQTGLPAVDVLISGADQLVPELLKYRKK